MPASQKKLANEKKRKGKGIKQGEQEKREKGEGTYEKEMLYVAPSALVAGFGFNLAQMFPDLARKAKLRGLFALPGSTAATRRTTWGRIRCGSSTGG
jgi:hypothetical protein